VTVSLMGDLSNLLNAKIEEQVMVIIFLP
jgi:hypothetical protein